MQSLPQLQAGLGFSQNDGAPPVAPILINTGVGGPSGHWALQRIILILRSHLIGLVPLEAQLPKTWLLESWLVEVYVGTGQET